MQALGLIETEGLLAAIVSVDTMLKAADVGLVDKIYVGGGLVSIAITGDVGAVKVAVEAGAAAIDALDSSLLVSQHVIPRPQEDIKSIISSKESIKNEIFSEDNLKENDKVKKKEVKKEEVKTEIKEKEEDKKVEIKKEKDEEEIQAKDNKKMDLSKIDLKKLVDKEEVDNLINKYGVQVIIEALKEFKVIDLRKLARKYENFGIKGREISKADKKLLLNKFKQYYEKIHTDIKIK